MLKAMMQNNEGKNILLLGLSRENVVRLKEGKPIHINGDELGFENDVILVYGETEEQIYEDLQPMLKSETSFESKDQTVQ